MDTNIFLLNMEENGVFEDLAELFLKKLHYSVPSFITLKTYSVTMVIEC